MGDREGDVIADGGGAQLGRGGEKGLFLWGAGVVGGEGVEAAGVGF
jgi:hypothetical protein